MYCLIEAKNLYAEDRLKNMVLKKKKEYGTQFFEKAMAYCPRWYCFSNF